MAISLLKIRAPLQVASSLTPSEIHDAWPQVKLPYHIRVLIPCYKEELAIVQKTILAARTAILSEGIARTIYLCDDGKDPEKRAWVNSLGPDVVYVSGRYRKKGEMNGKSGNLNNVARQLYPAVSLPGNNIMQFISVYFQAEK